MTELERAERLARLLERYDGDVTRVADVMLDAMGKQLHDWNVRKSIVAYSFQEGWAQVYPCVYGKFHHGSPEHLVCEVVLPTPHVEIWTPLDVDVQANMMNRTWKVVVRINRQGPKIERGDFFMTDTSIEDIESVDALGDGEESMTLRCWWEVDELDLQRVFEERLGEKQRQ